MKAGKGPKMEKRQIFPNGLTWHKNIGGRMKIGINLKAFRQLRRQAHYRFYSAKEQYYVQNIFTYNSMN